MSVKAVFGETGETGFQRQFQQGNAFYQKGNYKEAIALYEGILSQGLQSAALYYNLGNTYFKSKNLGRCVLNYERALRLAPEETELLNNLSFVREILVDKVDISEAPSWFKKMMRPYHSLSLNGAALFASLFYALILLCAAYAVHSLSFRSVFFKRLFIPFLILFLFFAGIGISKFIERRFAAAIVVVEELDVRYGPSPDETRAFVLHSGTKCTIRETSGNWCLIWLSNDRGGWVPQEGVERI